MDSRRPSSPAPQGVPSSERTGQQLAKKTEELFRHGSDLYLAGRHQAAIHVWTRILFLDRGNPKAREAIERARRAVAERQRQLDVRAAEAARCLDAGAIEEARSLVGAILRADAGHSEARALLEKLETHDRRENGARAVSMPSRPIGPAVKRPPRPPRSDPGARRRGIGRSASLKMAVFWFSVCCLFTVGGVYLHLNWDFLVGDPTLGPTPRLLRPAPGQEVERPAVPTAAELHYFNAERLFAKGQYREALPELARVDRSSAYAEKARGLILRIQARLLRENIEPELAQVRQEPNRRRSGL